MARITLLNTVNAHGMDEWVAHKDGCRDIRKDLRHAGVWTESTGLDGYDGVAAYMDDTYGVDAGYESPWTAAHVTFRPCTRVK